jgi:hypothetical protein
VRFESKKDLLIRRNVLANYSAGVVVVKSANDRENEGLRPG